MTEPLFDRLCLIGAGLIGGSIARRNREGHALAREIVVTANSQATRDRVRELGFADRVEDDLAEAVTGADCVILCVPVGVYAGVPTAVSAVRIALEVFAELDKG